MNVNSRYCCEAEERKVEVDVGCGGVPLHSGSSLPGKAPESEPFSGKATVTFKPQTRPDRRKLTNPQR